MSLSYYVFIVLFQPVNIDQRNGVILQYHVTLLNLNTGVKILSSIGNVTNHGFSVDVNQAYRVLIKAATKVGISEHAAQVYIPPHSEGTIAM